eukprot:m.406620 g.406620  ORF g.406620 m.406620 type:complete len:535 (+) comp20135_c1_seq1:681-2285(+)
MANQQSGSDGDGTDDDKQADHMSFLPVFGKIFFSREAGECGVACVKEKHRSVMRLPPRSRDPDDADMLAAVLHHLWHLDRFPVSCRREIAQVVRLRTLADGEVIAAHGSCVTSFFAVVRGIVEQRSEKVMVGETYTERQPFGAGEVFGQACLVPTWAQCRSVLDTELPDVAPTWGYDLVAAGRGCQLMEIAASDFEPVFQKAYAYQKRRRLALVAVALGLKDRDLVLGDCRCGSDSNSAGASDVPCALHGGEEDGFRDPLAGLDAPMQSVCRRVASHLTCVERFKHRQTVVWQGDPQDKLFLVASGSCRAIVQAGNEAQDPMQMLVREWQAPALFGHHALLLGQRQQTTVVCTGPVECFTMSPRQYLHCFETKQGEKARQALMATLADSIVGDGHLDSACTTQLLWEDYRRHTVDDVRYRIELLRAANTPCAALPTRPRLRARPQVASAQYSGDVLCRAVSLTPDQFRDVNGPSAKDWHAILQPMTPAPVAAVPYEDQGFHTEATDRHVIQRVRRRAGKFLARQVDDALEYDDP